MDKIIETYKEYIIIDKKVLDELNERANELDKDSKGIYTQGISKGIRDSINLIKEKKDTYKGIADK